MIYDKQYKDWSFEFHSSHAREPIAVQMELTYRCPVRCLHCYTDCYNNMGYMRQELAAAALKEIIDNIHKAGFLWLTFSGGDPLIRPDFLQIYNYAKKKGFVVSVKTSLAFLTDEILKKMVESPPFVISMTLNGITKKTYEDISQVRGSFKKVMANIDRVLSAGLPLKINTLISKHNIHERDRIKEFVESKGLVFSPSSLVSARLNGDRTPCRYRLSYEGSARGDLRYECGPGVKEKTKGKDSNKRDKPASSRLFLCGAGTWQWYINPYGRLNICSYLREPYSDLLNCDIREGVRILSAYVKNREFRGGSKCRNCKIRYLCCSCPGQAALETGDEEAPIPYFCELAKREAERRKVKVS